jgi:hypothetical protein
VIKFHRLALLTIVLALTAMPARAVDPGIYTIVDGEVRVLRGATWFRLAAGARILEGDVIDVGEHGQLQLELTDGGKLNAQGPALMHAASIPTADGKSAGIAEFAFQRGWFKAAAPRSRPLRVRLTMMTVAIADAVVVANCDPRRAELFVESGTANVALPRSKDGPPRDAAAGEFVVRADDRAPVVSNRPPPTFLAAMPRPFRDALPGLAGRFPVAPESLIKGSEVSLAEAEPWLSGANRKSFVRRFTPRLADPAFRAAVAARPAAYPEWDRVLHPEKYRPKETTDAK